uniref:RING-type E3 ubiquitin transferase n=1 Tax=Tetradesmus obliquus TaxID=3088 RepID=A0A383WCS5_TETOB|eukprot:jgi/Sobl393_1/1392/SZX75033.1
MQLASGLRRSLNVPYSCQQHALHPFNAAAAQQHATSCAALAASIAKRKRDGAIECGICYEKVLGKADVSSRRFGLMACEHSFCLGCIRSWRSTAEVDKVTALRTCPICRTPTHFITPSGKWPDTAADKEAIVSAYKAAMGQRDCSHFDFGEGSCPFGTSCFYRHAYKDGRLEEVQLRRAANDEGQVRVLGPVQLSSFLEASLTAQRAFSSAAPQRQQQQQQQQGRGREQRQQQQEPGAGGSSSRSSSSSDAAAAVELAAAESAPLAAAEEQGTEQPGVAEQHQRAGHADAADEQELQQGLADMHV